MEDKGFGLKGILDSSKTLKKTVNNLAQISLYFGILKNTEKTQRQSFFVAGPKTDV